MCHKTTRYFLVIRARWENLQSSIVKFHWDVVYQKLSQETQLSLTNRATRLEVSQGHQTWYHSIC